MQFSSYLSAWRAGYAVPLSAMRVYKRFLSVTICSAVISVICALAGMLIAILADTPVGSTIVAIDILVFLIFSLIGALTGMRRR